MRERRRDGRGETRAKKRENGLVRLYQLGSESLSNSYIKIFIKLAMLNCIERL
jgi:hypothetical protein